MSRLPSRLSGPARSHRGSGRTASTDDDFETLASAPTDDEATSTASARARKGPSLKARAIGFLSRREHSRVELQRKLAPYTEDSGEIDALLVELERENWLSNERFAQSLVNRRAPLRGSSRIVQELRQHGLEDEQISALSQELKSTELERARQVWEKKFAEPPSDSKEYARQFRFLASRGFSSDCLRRILGELPS